MFTIIDSIDDLSYLNKELLQKSYVGVDTEFRRTTKFNMRLALLQINDGEEVYLVDSLLLDEPEDSCSFLFSNTVTKIFHSCKEDIEAIFAWTNQEMKNIFDTQIANSLLDGDYSIGYQGLVEQEFGIVLNKSETRSNWMRRPLSDSQLKYAALDVEYLIYLYELQKEKLSKTSKLDWHDQEVDRILKITLSPFQPISLERTINKSEEVEILKKFNKVVEEISNREKINPTLFFSKKAQKDFLRMVLNQGIDFACKNTTDWREKLIKEVILKLLK